MARKRTTGGNAKGKMKRKAYEKELRELQVELCALQDWVKDKGARIIIVFEGRDAAGKGGTIKAITERVSPAGLPHRCAAGTVGPGKDATVHAALYRALPGGGRSRHLRPQLVQPRGRRIRHGILQRGTARAVSRALPGGREIHRRWRHHLDQDLAGGRQGRAGTAVFGAHRRPVAAVEIEPDGSGIVSGAGTTTRGRAT